MMRRLAVLLFAGSCSLLSAMAGAACTPGARDAARELAPVVPPLTRAVCVLLHAFSPSGVLEEVCATAEELAPFVPEILAARAERHGGPVAVETIGALDVAVSLPPPVRPVRRRRCVAWVDAATDAGAVEGGADASR